MAIHYESTKDLRLRCVSGGWQWQEKGAEYWSILRDTREGAIKDIAEAYPPVPHKRKIDAKFLSF